MTAIITYKSTVNAIHNPEQIIDVIAILDRPYSIKIITARNKIRSYEKCDIENLFVRDFKDGR